MEKGVISIIFISLFILFGSVAFIIGIPPPYVNDVAVVCTPECTGTDKCDASGQCVECLDDGDCASEESCDASGSCVAGCTSDSQCADVCVDNVCVECAYNIDCDSASGETCVEGSCVTEATTCSDPDGLDYYVRETCTDSTGTTITDLCTLDGTILHEAYCGTSGDDSFCVSLPYNCLAGEVCLDGACVDSVRSSCDTYIIVSNRSTLIGGDMSIHSVPIPAWTAVIPEARWIWEEASVSNPEVNRTVVFTKTFYINDLAPGIIGGIDGELVIAADNSYSCTLNGLFVGADSSENNFRDDTKDTYSLDETRLKVGENILVCEVKNWAQVGGTGATNPAGLLYRLEVNNGICMIEAPTCTDTDGGVNYFSPGNASTDESFNIDSCSEDGSSLTEYYCLDGAITSIEFPCVCTEDDDGGYCEISGAGLVCKEFNSHSVVAGALVPMPETEMRDFVDEEIQQRLGLEETHEGFIAALILSEVPVKSKVKNSGGVDDIYYCGLDLLWHGVKYTVADIACINEPNIPCLSNTACLSDSECYLDYSCENMLDKEGNEVVDENEEPTITFCNYNTACLEDHECTSNTCVDNYCISISAELIAQRGFLIQIWCVVTNLPSYISEGDQSTEYGDCLVNAFGGL